LPKRLTSDWVIGTPWGGHCHDCVHSEYDDAMKGDFDNIDISRHWCYIFDTVYIDGEVRNCPDYESLRDSANAGVT
jgi:hypothetical protein